MALLTILAAVAAGVAIMATADTEDEDTKLAKISPEDLQYQEMVLNKVNYRTKKKDGNGKPRIVSGSGYVKKSDLDALNLSTVPIPANFAGLEAVMTPTRLQDQLFEIVDVDEEENEVTITARHIWYRNLQNNTLWKPTADQNYTAAAVCRNILTNAIYPSDSNVASDCTDTKPGKDLDFERKNLVEAFLDPEKGVCKLFGLSLIRDNMDFYCLKEVGFNRGFVVEAGKNMLGVERQENIENLATRVAPIAKDAKGNIVWMDYNGKKYLDSQYISDYATPRLEIYDTGMVIGKNGVTSDNIQEKLLAAAQKRFSDDKVDLPEVTMTVEFVSLGDTEEYKQYRDLDKVYLYDIITVKDPEKGYNYSAQVIGVEHDILTGMLNSVTIGSLQQADATRKIAVWQVPEVDGTNIRLQSLQAGVYAPGSINTADIAPSTITADLIKAGEIQTIHLAAESITTDKLEAGAVTAGKIAAGAITTEKLDAYAVTTAKIAAGAVTTDKLDAGVITADKISATDLSAINAKLGTASIAQAEIEVADINFAHIKDLNASSAYFGQTIFDEGIGGKLYVPRLSVGYAQMIGATIGDLVIQASNGNFYGIDVDTDGNVTATQRTVSASEIAAGHTTDGRTLVLGTDILATDLTTENIYASHALMNEITAATISVDELWARTAFIGHLMTTDISSNTYIQTTIGNWTSGSTITQTINSLNSRISQLGYGTIYYQATEPSHSGLVEGDIWVKSSTMADWTDVYDTFDDWEDVYDAFDDWQTLCAVDRMYVWTGVEWKEMYDADLPNTLQTEINQLASEISLKASLTQVNALANDVSEFYAELTIQAQEIQSAVSAVNLKAASYVMEADPRTAYTVSVGDIWVKWDGTTDWTAIYNEHDDWKSVYDTYDEWGNLFASQSYVWNGWVWVETSDRASEINQRTLIDQTINQVTILAEASAEFQNELIRTQASITVTNSSIQQEVLRATTAENSKLDKTSQYQNADSIVTAARNYVNGILTNESQIEQLATGITAYVADHAYGIQSGVAITAAGIEISGGKYVKVKTNGQFLVDSGNFSIDGSGNVIVKGKLTAYADSVIAGWTLASNNLHAGLSGNYVALASSGTYAFWAGSDTAASAPCRIKFNGEATFTKLMILGENNQETEINLRTYGLWKLNYQTVKSYGTNSITLSNGATVNFNTAASVTLTGGWSGSTFTVSNSGNAQTSSASVEFGSTLSSIAAYLFTAQTHTATMSVRDSNRGNTVLTEEYDATALYNAVVTSARAEGAAGVTVDSIDVIQTSRNGKKIWYIATTATASNDATKNATITLDATDSYDDGYADATPSSAVIGSYVSAKTYTVTITQADDNTVDVDVDCSTPFDAGRASGSPASGTASGRSGSSYAWTFRILSADGGATNLGIDCTAIYSDARQGYTQGIFSQYSGDTLYTIGQYGPQVYSGTLYTKS